MKTKNKIQFVISINNPYYAEECLKYIKQLSVPEGYQIDWMLLTNGASMTSNYNKALQESDAKYKIYLHQDTFILNKNLLSDLVELFADQSIGIVGCVGKRKVAADANFLSYDVGNILMQSGYGVMHLDDHLKYQEKYVDVLTVDGCFIATQYDITWREDLFTDWDFYDVSACYEMRKAGYRVVVPIVEQPWIYHDCGPSKLEKYFKNRDIFAKEYLPDVELSINEQQENVQLQMENMANLFGNQLKSLVEQGRYVEISQMAGQIRANGIFNRDICRALSLVDIYIRGAERSSLLQLGNWEQLKELYHKIVFALIRLGHGMDDVVEKDFLKTLLEKEVVSQEALVYMAESVLEKEKDTRFIDNILS